MYKKYIYILIMPFIIACFLARPLEAFSNLELKGTVFTPSLKPIAIIKDVATGKIRMYEPGENIGDMKVLEIKRAEVVLQGENIRHVLALAEGSVMQPEFAGLDIVEDSSIFQIKKKDAKNILANIPRIIKDLRLLPHFEKGRPGGMRLSKVKKGSIFEKAGVMPGDIVKSVNGMSLNTPHQIFNAYKKLKNSNNFKVEIVRDGKKQMLEYEIK